MVSCRVVVCSILVSVFAWTSQASAGWVIDQVVKGVGEGGRQQVMLQANRMKTLMLGADGEPVTAFILDLNAQTITQVDYVKRQYTTTTVQEFGQMMQGAQQMASEHMTEAMKGMQEAMKDMPPEQRKMMEEMMRSQMPQAKPSPEECREPRIEIKKTGQQATIAGYPAVRYDVLADGKLESELWLATGITAWREMGPQKLERFGAEMAKLAPRCGPAQKRYGLLREDPAWKLVSEGYPVRIVDRGGSGGTIEVLKAETRTVPASEFQPPTGFERKTFREMMGQ
jgi:hypothetical protein